MHTVSLCLCVNKRIDIWTVLQILRQASCCLCVWMTIWQLSPRLQEPVGTCLRWSTVSRRGGMDGEMTELTERDQKSRLHQTKFNGNSSMFLARRPRLYRRKEIRCGLISVCSTLREEQLVSHEIIYELYKTSYQLLAIYFKTAVENRWKLDDVLFTSI